MDDHNTTALLFGRATYRKEVTISSRLAHVQYCHYWRTCLVALVLLLSGPLQAENGVYNPLLESPQKNLDSGIGNVAIYNQELTEEATKLTKQMMQDDVLEKGENGGRIRFDITPATIKEGSASINGVYAFNGQRLTYDPQPRLENIRAGLQRAAEDAYISLFPEGVMGRTEASNFVRLLDVKFARHNLVTEEDYLSGGAADWHIDISTLKPNRDDLTVLHVVNGINDVNYGTEFLQNHEDIEASIRDENGKYPARNSFEKNTVSVHFNSNALAGKPTAHRGPWAPPGYVKENDRFVIFAGATVKTNHPDYPKHLLARMGRFTFDSDRAVKFARDVLEFESLFDGDELDEVVEELIETFKPELQEGYRNLDVNQKKRLRERFVDSPVAIDFPELDELFLDIIGFGDC